MSNITHIAPTNESMLAVLQTSLYPGASLQSIGMVIEYCRAAGLDPMQKPVHIVPMWDRSAGHMRDVIMPGINLYRIQASRSQQFAGISEPEFGPDVVAVIGGQEITYPDWCKVTVKRRLASGEICDFTAKEYWMENYAVKGGKEKSVAPNAMWTKRPKGQIAKCASAQALRSAFPEIAAQYTAEEMEGKALNDIEEHDPLNQPRNFGLTPARSTVVRNAARAALQKFNEGDEAGAYEEASLDDNEEKLALWSILKPHSALRSSLKRTAEEIAKRDAAMAAMEPPAAVETEGEARRAAKVAA